MINEWTRPSRRQRREERLYQLFRCSVVDLASAPELSSLVLGRLKDEAQTLLSPEFDVRIHAVGPWLVDLAKISELEPAVAETCRGKPWGYFIEAGIDIVSLRSSLRRFNIVKLPDPDREVLFRYWDPRVMQAFLHLATRAQKNALFDFIDRIEGPDGMFDEHKSS